MTYRRIDHEHELKMEKLRNENFKERMHTMTWAARRTLKWVIIGGIAGAVAHKMSNDDKTIIIEDN